jgi:tripartite-type tricarboxylate transporter receptor subunit TctC
VNQTRYAKPGFDPRKDLTGISLIAKVPLVFLATPESGIRTLADLTARAKAEPGRLSYASAGIGGTQHLSGEMYKSAAHVFITHIPYRGSGPAQSDFLGNQIPLMVDSVTAALPHIKSGRAVALAVTSATRSSQLPDVPTVRESGVAGTKNFEAVGWLGLMAPRGTPADIVERLNREVTDILKSEQMARFIRERGAEPAPTTPAEFDRFVASEIGVWGAAVKASGAKPE